MNIQICITTYERAASLDRLVGDLEQESAQRVRIYDDCSRMDDYETVRSRVERHGWVWQRATTNYGKVGHSKLWASIWRDLEASASADLYVFLQDDNRLCRRFFKRLAETWQSLGDVSAATLMLMTDTRDTIWGAAEGPVRAGPAVERIGWVDTMFACPARTLHDLSFTFPTASPGSATGSGAGRGLTQAIRRLGRTMYRANPSLVAHVALPSRMHVKEREKHPLYATNFVDGEERHQQFLRGEV